MGYRSEHITSFDRWLYFSFQRGEKKGKETKGTHAQWSFERCPLRAHRGTSLSSGRTFRRAKAVGLWSIAGFSFPSHSAVKAAALQRLPAARAQPFPHLLFGLQTRPPLEPMLLGPGICSVTPEGKRELNWRHSTCHFLANDSHSKVRNSAALQKHSAHSLLVTTLSLSNLLPLIP